MSVILFTISLFVIKNSLLTLGADVESYICKNLAHSINEEGIKKGEIFRGPLESNVIDPL